MTTNIRMTFAGSESLNATAEPLVPEPAPPATTIFTKPSEPVGNDGYDNVENNLIVRAHDHIWSPEGKE